MSGFVGKNIIFLLISQSATWVVSLVTLVVVARLLGPAEFGAIGYAFAFVQYFALIAGFETGPLLVRTVAQDHSVAGVYAYNALIVKVLLCIPLSAIAIGVAFALDLDALLIGLIAIGCVGMLFTTLNTVLQSTLAGMHRMGRPAMWNVVQLYVGTAIGVLVIVVGGGALIYYAVVALAGLVPLLANYRALQPEIAAHRRIDTQIWKVLMTSGLPLLVLTGLNMVYGSIDVLMLQGIRGDTVVGWYTFAYRWASVPIFICTAVVAAFFPRFSEYGVNPGPKFAEAVNRAVWLTVLVSAPCAFVLAGVAEDLVHFLYPNGDYDEAIRALQVLAVQIPIAAVDTVLATALVASNRFHKYIFVSLAASILTPIALWFAIDATADDIGGGTVGAALVTTFTEVFVFTGALLLRSKGVMDRTTVRRCLAAVAAAAALLLLLRTIDGFPLVAKGVIAMVAYVPAALLLGAVKLSELRDILRRVQQTVGGVASNSRRVTEDGG